MMGYYLLYLLTRLKSRYKCFITVAFSSEVLEFLGFAGNEKR